MTLRPHPAAEAAAADERWYALEIDAVLARLHAHPSGLTSEEAQRRLDRYGPNRLPAGRRRGALRRLLLQFHNLLIYVLLGAGVLAAAIGHEIDALVILAVVLINAAIGFVQEGRAERALEAISGMIDPHAAVLRGGRRLTIPADALVPGDVVLLEPGDRISADLRLLSLRTLRVDEAILTGESIPVDKRTAPVAADSALGDRFSMAYSGTLVTAGQGRGVVVATGGATVIGHVSAMIGGVERLTTPLVRQTDEFARHVTAGVLAASGLVFAYALLVQAYSFEAAFMAVIGLAVAAIPEGLPAVMTIALAVGVQRMARRSAIIRQLPAVETLGSVSVICSDKTGTLTRNEMVVRTVVTLDAQFEVEGAGYRPQGRFLVGGTPADPAAEPVLEELALAALLCNDAQLRQAGEVWLADGDPMEGALVSLAAKAGHDTAAARARLPRLDEIPFDSRHRFMATLHAREDRPPVVYVKGAPEPVFAMCHKAAAAGRDHPFDHDHWRRQVEILAAEGLRVLAFARRSMPASVEGIDAAALDRELTLLGLVGLIDPPRPEVVAAVNECKTAGIRIKMITGDHVATAKAIARQLGLADNPVAVTGQHLDALDDAGFRACARDAAVFARTSPEHKLRLVEALQADGSIIAMTGDGVNDAPALKRADIGVAMGRKGTEAAKEASAMVLADDNFASIVAAVREGRTVHDNLAKVISWTLPTNVGEAFIVIVAILFGLALPVSPIQILWINMITASALGLTLAFEPTEAGAMSRPPRPARQALISGRLLWRMLYVAVLMVAGTFSVYVGAIDRGLGVETARTLVVNTLVAMEIFYLFSVRHLHRAQRARADAWPTPAVLIGVAAVMLAQFAFTYLPWMQKLFESRPVSFKLDLTAAAAGLALLLLVELEKRLAFRFGFNG